MQIKRLRLLGFKSFVEPTELLIEPGLTGVVGPNGCGKSNLLEALRWVMGETSYKNMRGGAMDDVIFAGTDTRPSRNMAEVSLTLDNSARKAPAEFNDSDTLEISRRIQREAGSIYKVNGKDVRARDVQLLFADAATGARSQALVRQGQIGEIISAKPQDRRRILEDAAGIAGLHGRRHEAELRLKGAESNIERLRDVMGQLGSQLQSLRKQARQAQRYKEISVELRRYEAIQHHLQWTSASEHVTAEEAAQLDATRQVGQLTQAESSAMRIQAEIAETLQPLREEEATRAAVLHRLEVERQTLDREEQRAKDRYAELETRLAQLQRDIDRETDAIGEAKELLKKLDAEEEELRDSGEDDGAAREIMQEAVAEAAAALEATEDALQAATSAAAEARASRTQAEARIQESSGRVNKLNAQAAELDRQIRALGVSPDAMADVEMLREQVAQLAEELEIVEAQTTDAEAALPEARAREKEARETAGQARLKARQLETEVATLVKLLKPDESAKWRPVVDDIRVSPGFEIALGAALSDDLEAGLDASAPVRWSLVAADGDAPLPAGAEPLSSSVKAPAELARRLAQIGVVDRAQGAALQPQLRPGQRLVSREGDVWRWDGFIAAGDAPTAAAKRLAERNRLGELEEQVSALLAMAEDAEAAREAATEAVNHAQQQEKSLRDRWRQLQAQAGSSRDKLVKAERAIQEHTTKLTSLTDAAARIEEAREEAAAIQFDAEAALDALAPTADLEARQQAAMAAAAAKRSAFAEAKSRADGIEREIRARQMRLEAISAERKRWLGRDGSAEQQIATLHERLGEIRREMAELGELPVKIEERRQRILNELSQAEEQRRLAATTLAESEHAVREQERALREAQSALGKAREERARIEARLEAAREKRQDQARMIREMFECSAEECLAVAGVEAGKPLPPLDEVEQSIVKLKADRERLGGVNLRAEEEAETLGAEFDGLEKERADLEEAIAKLRQGIINLNKEGRKRLMEAFETVNGHFQRLFKILFGGGEAELQLIESDDPLESGLEILARPPGKKPQVLTLLSGGEKALTALALIFAVFQTNPSPICVLDEVDAPLDDANVHRFNAMLEEMTKTTDTRFLVITHNPITMAIMSRLFGVTMQEKGVSQLVSVDLQTAERFREAS
ncbi:MULTISPECIES: chromosome segregation protein SMC [Rhodomicrobium]|uniref:chromosome segregation protein SMC n=1 Tax=Rhodomicrobium TaxID=1068 RepID=UPI000B4AE3DD|nr:MULTISPECIES: chromosome segregation protein SMC [Rhodomicrobium]